jgi:signal transduction histidine kinase
MLPPKNHIGSDSTRFDSNETIRKMDGAWRVWESLITWDTRFAWLVDSAVAVGLFLFCSGWLFEVGGKHPALGFVAALTAPLFFRRRYPFTVFLVISAVALGQLVTTDPLLADVSLLVALYSVAAESGWIRVMIALSILEVGVVAATVHWTPIGSHFESLVFLTGMAFAAFLTGAVVRALRDQINWLGERAQRLELERDQQSSLAAATERARIAREMHDVISHNLQVMVTLADAACVGRGHFTDRATEAMTEVANTGRQAMTDMRRMLGLLRDGAEASSSTRGTDPRVEPPQPGIGEMDALVERVRCTGLPVELNWQGELFTLSEAAELTIYRIVQEGLTNTLRHATSADEVIVALTFSEPDVSVRVEDNGRTSSPPSNLLTTNGQWGHGVANMTERAAAFGGTLSAGSTPNGGWVVETTLYGCSAPVRV